jgi:methylenetetrahydrofolate dehydrogenase (NADP+)/methenyltetrahydrofolate cyclohydrolase
MTAKILDGKELAARLRTKLAAEAKNLRELGVVPKIVSIQVEGDEASSFYVRNQAKTANKAGIEYEHRLLPNTIGAESLAAAISAANDDPSVTGIILQVPLPKGLDGNAFQQMISPAKDIEGITTANLGALVLGGDDLVPCTARAAVEMVLDAGIPIAGKHVVVVGRSNIVGKPLALMMLQRHATVSICHSKTPDLGAVCRQADILMTAVGAKAGLVTRDMIKPGADVIDIAIIPTAEGGITGDVDAAGAMEVAGSLAPVPGGVGPVTVCMLLRNALIAARKQARQPVSA